MQFLTCDMLEAYNLLQSLEMKDIFIAAGSRASGRQTLCDAISIYNKQRRSLLGCKPTPNTNNKRAVLQQTKHWQKLSVDFIPTRPKRHHTWAYRQ